MRTTQRQEARCSGAAALALLLLLPGTHLLAASDLLSAARAEKRIVLYHTTTVPDTQQIIQAFKKKHPWAEVESYRATGEKLFQRIVSEVKAGRNLADVYIISGLQTWLLKDMGLLSPYASPEREKVHAALKDEEGYWTGVYWNLEVVGYNTKLTAPTEVPRQWEDLLAPRWKGRLALEEEDIYWYTMILQLMGEEKGRNYARQLAKQQLQIRAGHTLLAQLLAAGEFALTPTMRTVTAEDLKAKGAPVEWTAIEPVAPNPPVTINLPRSAPRPNMAKLFIDFVLSQEGQRLLVTLKRNPTRTDVEQPIPRTSKIKLIPIDNDVFAKNYGRYTKEYREIFGVR